MGFFFLLNPKFKKHPYPLFAYATLFQSIYFLIYQSVNLICPLDMPWFASKWITLPQDMIKLGPLKGLGLWIDTPEVDVDQKYRIFILLFAVWRSLIVTSTFLYMTGNSIIFIDLYLTLRHPFYPRGKRNKFYILALLLVFITCVALSARMDTNQKINDYYIEDNAALKYISMGFLAILTLATILPFVLSIAYLFRRGTSTKLRKKVANRYIFYFFLYLIMVLCTVLDFTNGDYIEDLQRKYNLSKFVAATPAYIFSFIGMPIVLIRFLEPFVLQEFLISSRKIMLRIKKIFCCQSAEEASQKKKMKYSHESLCSFVNSAMNIELVNVILLGIGSLMDKRNIEKLEQAKESS